MQELIFTRLLYPYTDVIQSLYESYKSKSNFDECLYWMSEIYFSMFYEESYFILYFLYFNFNVHFDSELKLYNTIQESQQKWEKSYSKSPTQPNNDIFFKLFYKMYNWKYIKNYNDELIAHENSEDRNKLTIYKGKKPNFINSFEKLTQNIIYSLHKQNNSNTWNYIEKYFDYVIENQLDIVIKFKELLTALNKYINSSDNSLYTKKNVLEYLNIFQYFRVKHSYYHISVMKSIILYIVQNDENIKFSKFKKMKPTNDVNKTYLSHYNYDDDYIQSLKLKTYKIIPTLRKYKLILPIERSIDEAIELRCIYFFHWIDYIDKCPLWNKRLNNFNANLKNGRVNFTTDDTELSFHDNYNYEPDEQSLEITQMLCI